jgi:hypothetical protein
MYKEVLVDWKGSAGVVTDKVIFEAKSKQPLSCSGPGTIVPRLGIFSLGSTQGSTTVVVFICEYAFC